MSPPAAPDVPVSAPAAASAGTKRPGLLMHGFAGLTHREMVTLTRRLIDLNLASLGATLLLNLFAPQVFANPIGLRPPLALAVLFLAIARWVCRRGHPQAAMLMVAGIYVVVMGGIAAVAAKPALFAFPVFSLLPSLAIVIGLRTAVAVGFGFVAVIGGVLLSRDAGVELPVLFPGGPALEMVLLATNLLTLLIPLPILLRAIHSAQVRMSDFISVSADRFWETDTEHRLTELWRQGGVPPELRKHWIGRRPWEVTPTVTAQQEEQWSRYRRMVAAREPIVGFEYQAFAADGATHWLSVNGLPVFDEGGRFQGYRGCSTFIDERKQREEESAALVKRVEDANARLADFAAAGTDRFWETDAQHRFADMWGSDDQHSLAPRAYMLGRTRWEISPARNADEERAWADHIAKLDAREPINDFEYLTQQPDGSRRWVSISGRPIFGPDGAFRGYRGRVSDISWRKEKEVELVRARHDAEAANRAKSDFLATMSHEIRTPMNGIMGMTTLALEEAASDKQREYLTVVQDSAQSLLAIINDILDLSKIEAGRMELESVPLEVRSLVNGTLKTLSFTAYNKGVELAAEVADDVPAWVAGDPTRLRQVLLNLTSNAVKFTPKQGRVTVRVKRDTTDPTGSTLRFEVQDTGIGIAEDKLETIFQPFSQADSSTTRQYGGTGLGLTICRRLVQMMGGQIGVQSTVGVGSTFHFTARLGPAEAPQQQPPQTQAQNRSLKVLLAEDHPINQMPAVTLLQRAGHQVTVAANGQEAVEQWRADRPDVILMDVQMPILDGLAATQRIREAEAAQQLARMPIIAMTANAFAEDRQACIAAGMDAYLYKPVKPEVLYASLGEAVSAGPMGQGH